MSKIHSNLLSNEIDDLIGANRHRIMTPHIRVRNHGGVCEVVSCYVIDFRGVKAEILPFGL